MPTLDTPVVSSEDISYTSTVIDWADVTNATGYTFEWRLGDSGAFTSEDITTSTYTLSDLTPNTEYNYKITATASGYDDGVTAVSEFTTDRVAPDIIFDFTGAAGQFFFDSVQDTMALIPTRIFAVSDIASATRTISDYNIYSPGVFSNDISIIDVIEDSNIASGAEATEVASRLATQYRAQAYQGDLSALMNVTVEPADIVEVRNAPLAAADYIVGEVSRVVRTYNAPRREYTVDINLGDAQSYPVLTRPSVSLEEVTQRQTSIQLLARYQALRARHRDNDLR